MSFHSDIDWNHFHFLGLNWIDLVLLIIVAGVCGGVARAITGNSRGGCLASVFVGFIGALLADLLSRYVDLPPIAVLRVGSFSFPLVWSIIGACVFMSVLALLTRRRVI